MDNGQSFGARACFCSAWILALVQVRAWGGLSGRRYEHIPVRLTEAIHGFRHSRKGLPMPAQIPWCRFPRNCDTEEKRQVPGLKSGCGVVFRKSAEPWMAEPKRHMDVPKERFSEHHPTPATTPNQNRIGVKTNAQPQPFSVDRPGNDRPGSGERADHRDGHDYYRFRIEPGS